MAKKWTVSSADYADQSALHLRNLRNLRITLLPPNLGLRAKPAL
jgi:hypothetical protein